MKQIQISEQLFMELMKFHLLDMEENLPSIKQGLEAKLDSLVMRDLYSKYKIASTEEELPPEFLRHSSSVQIFFSRMFSFFLCGCCFVF